MHRVRKAETGDGKRIAEIQVGGWQSAYRGIIPDDYLNALNPEKRVTFWSQQADNESSDLFVTILGATVTGFCHLIPSRDDDGTGVAEIAAIYVDPCAWRQGCGRQLCEAAFEAARRRGASSVTLWVLEANLLGRSFYEAIGFRTDGSTKSEERPGFLLEEVRYRIDPSKREQDVTGDGH
ncbi:GNAT family N-acetyltransferase [Luteolibacter pohnpeiensis]|uniref:GNAT family N-acetyltransferase n=1 Tax=Luteolibacter pohnpeiensis TaxID=454153 RepID=A0A934VV98_9BACT|nr:GNAT family N-acetyltransferase [Luteolibacter pohnpeiensis]MBK1881960.1 GNAT family N-acetyltransferase [Luteolibacter pohnpeiensis]